MFNPFIFFCWILIFWYTSCVQMRQLRNLTWALLENSGKFGTLNCNLLLPQLILLEFISYLYDNLYPIQGENEAMHLSCSKLNVKVVWFYSTFWIWPCHLCAEITNIEVYWYFMMSILATFPLGRQWICAKTYYFFSDVLVSVRYDSLNLWLFPRVDVRNQNVFSSHLGYQEMSITVHLNIS